MVNSTVSVCVRSSLLLVLAGMVCGMVPGCSIPDSTFVNRYYEKDSFRITSPRATFTYETDPVVRTMEVGDGYNKRVYKDTTDDQQVDTVVFREETYHRQNEEARAIFERADSEWKTFYHRLNVEEVHEEWEQMTPEARAREGGYFAD